ncbi:MAG: phasin family protein [Myxococcota bacterium]
MADSPLMKKLRERARTVTQAAAREVMGRSGPRGGEALGAAVRGAQSGRKVLDESSAKVLEALGLATRDDVEALSRRIGRLRKRVQRMVDSLD